MSPVVGPSLLGPCPSRMVVAVNTGRRGRACSARVRAALRWQPRRDRGLLTWRVERAAALALLLCGCASGAAWADDKPDPPAAAASQPAPAVRRPGVVRRRSFEIAASGSWVGGAGLGAADAKLIGNSTGTESFTLFSASTRLQSAPGFGASIGFNLTRAIGVEGAVTSSKPVVRTSISGDAEGARTLDVEEDLRQYFFDVSLVWRLKQLAPGDRGAPFLLAGAGYLRQLHEGQTVIENGSLYHLGGGVKYLLFSRAGRLKGVGVRGDARVYIAVGGFGLEQNRRMFGAGGGGLFLVF